MAQPTRNHLFCFGYGFTASALAALIRRDAAPWRISGTSRDDDRIEAMRAGGVMPYRFDGGKPVQGGATPLASATHILIAIPPDSGGDPVLRHHAHDFAAMERLQWLGYLSTTGVYGDSGGAWVNEETPINPGSERARRRVAAEEAWADLARKYDLPLHVFRCAGIYGKGRSALDKLRDGKAVRISAPGHVRARVHVDDVALVLRASMAHPTPMQVYNVADDVPSDQSQVYQYAAELLGIAPPPEVPLAEAELTPMGRSFYAENRRIANNRIKDRLGVALAYPGYREGLAAVLKAGG